MAKKIRLAFIGTYPEVSRIFMQITAEMGSIQAICIDASFESAAARAQELEPELDAILSRGGTAEYIQNAVNIPVIYIPITPFDVVKALHSIPEKTKKAAIIYYRKNVLNIKEIEKLYHIQLQEYLFTDYGDIEQSVRDANERDIQVVIGGEVAAKIAEKYGMSGYAVSAGYEAVARAIEEALQVLQEKRKEQNKSAQLKAAFSALVEGIVVLDESRRIIVSNTIAEKLFHRHYEVGEKPDDDLFSASCQEIYKKGAQAREINEIRRLNNGTFAVSYTPVKAKGKFVGVVCRYEDVTKVQKLERQIRKEIHAKGFVAKYTFPDILGTSPEIRKSINMAKVYTKADSSVLIEGESGTGKEFFAQSIHNASSRKSGPFVAVNCTAIPENLLESELFGYETGAFTGARKEGRAGFFEMAHGGTLFLDEIGEITESVQSRLLRVLQEREIMRVGGDKVIPIDVRVISATNRSLWKLSQTGKFRVDLFYRLNIFHLEIPPLREREGDVGVLCVHFAKKHGIELDEFFITSILPRLEQYTWPGNVRELESVMERYCLLKTLWEDDTPVDERIRALLGLPMEAVEVAQKLPEGRDLREMIENVEYEIVTQVLRACSNDQTAAAQRLGIGKTTLWRKLRLGNRE